MVPYKFFFNISWSPIAEGLMKAFGIVITVDVFEQSKSYLFNILKWSVLGEPLLFQFFQETFAGSV